MVNPWTPPTPRVAELMRKVAADSLADPTHIDLMNKQCLDAVGPGIANDPALASALAATNRSNVTHWLSRTVIAPGEPVAPAHSKETLAFARDLMRRGHDSAAMLTYLVGQNAAWQNWMHRCFERTSDLHELRELLDVSAQSIFGFLQDTIYDLGARLRAERDELTGGTRADRLELVTQLLQGADVDTALVGARLAHDLRREQTAAILWHAETDRSDDLLHRAALAVGLAVELGRPLRVVATSSSVWVWYSSVDRPDVAAMIDAATGFDGVRVAIGSTSAGLEGFRKSHREAQTTQRLMMRSTTAPLGASFAEVHIASLVAADSERALTFAQHILGPLVDADPVLRDTLRVYLREDTSAARTSKVLFAHRNTVLNRIARAEQLLAVPIEGNSLGIGLALEIIRWLTPA